MDEMAAARRWLCEMYWTRGQMTDETWEKFAAFAEANGFTDEPTPGKRVDGRDPWDVFEENISV